jgi:hypothetical protein
MVLPTYIDDAVSFLTFDFKTLGPKLVLPILTLIGALGGFPTPPKSFAFLAENRFFQYFFLWVLVMQGGASADPDLSLVAVLIFVLFIELVKYIENKKAQKIKEE